MIVAQTISLPCVPAEK